jgi:hypothetical protein
MQDEKNVLDYKFIRKEIKRKKNNSFFFRIGPPGPQGVPGDTGRHGEMGKEVI